VKGEKSGRREKRPKKLGRREKYREINREKRNLPVRSSHLFYVAVHTHDKTRNHLVTCFFSLLPSVETFLQNKITKMRSE